MLAPYLPTQSSEPSKHFFSLFIFFEYIFRSFAWRITVPPIIKFNFRNTLTRNSMGNYQSRLLKYSLGLFNGINNGFKIMAINFYNVPIKSFVFIPQ